MLMPAGAELPSFPAEFETRNIPTNGAVLHVRIGGQGPAAILLHGYGETGDMWAPLAAELVRDHTVVAPDLRGLGLSSRPDGGYDKKTQGRDVTGLLDALGIERADLITHDIGNMVGYAFAAQYPARVTRFVLMDAPLPGIGPWDEILKNPLLWHFRFGGPTWSGWSPAESAFISIASGTSFPPSRRPSAKLSASITPAYMHCPASCMQALPSLPPLIRTPSTAKC
jgi:pimeloyl-ACP methyl ester carboxylesterase